MYKENTRQDIIDSKQFRYIKIKKHFKMECDSCRFHETFRDQGPVVLSIISLTSSLRGQLVKYFTTLSLNTVIFLLTKMREAVAMQKLLTLFQQKILAYI